LAPVEIAIANWRGFISARQSVERISNLLNLMPARDQTMDLPKPHAQLQVEGLCVAAPGEKRPVLQNVSFSLQAGAGLGIIGPSASGKSTLVRTLVGAWLPQQGAVRLDDAILEQRRPDALGRFIGYLPQDIELFGGTVAQNIARFDPDAEAGAIIAAAKQAGIHEMILRLADGYDTRIGEGGASLSAGQRQRVALARALYGEPFLVVLDEPNSHLDAEGDAALTAAILGVRNRGGIAIVVAHRPSALSGVDQLLVLAQGQVQAFGPRDAMLRKVTTQAAGSLDNAAEQTARLRIISDTASSA
jgi:ATP-binding cassette subfamily C protein